MNPCTGTELVYAETLFEDMEYEIGESPVTQSFIGVTDTISDAVTTGGNCGNIAYTLTSNDTAVGTTFVFVTDLLNAKGLRLYTENEDNVGNFTVTIKATMESYPEFNTEFSLHIELKLAGESLSELILFPPILDTDVSEGFNLEPGLPWDLTIAATDPDDDLATIDVEFSGTAADWLIFD